MLPYLFSFRGRINRAKFWLYWPLAFAAEAVVFGVEWVIGWTANLDDPMDAMSPFFFEQDHILARWLGLAVLWTFFILYGWTLAVVSVKRLHDRGKGAIWALFFWGCPILLFAIMSATLLLRMLSEDAWKIEGMIGSTVGGVIVWWGIIEMSFFQGTKGSNRFGPDPLNRPA